MVQCRTQLLLCFPKYGRVSCSRVLIFMYIYCAALHASSYKIVNFLHCSRLQICWTGEGKLILLMSDDDTKQPRARDTTSQLLRGKGQSRTEEVRKVHKARSVRNTTIGNKSTVIDHYVYHSLIPSPPLLQKLALMGQNKDSGAIEDGLAVSSSMGTST